MDLEGALARFTAIVDGLGLEENVLTLCRPCHYAFDRGLYREEMTTYFRKYLQSKYPDWDEKKLYYRRFPNGNE